MPAMLKYGLFMSVCFERHWHEGNFGTLGPCLSPPHIFGLAAPVWVLKSKNPLQIDCFMATNLFFRIQMIVSRLFNHENTQNKRIRGWYGTSNQRSNIQLCHSNPGWAALNLISTYKFDEVLTKPYHGLIEILLQIDFRYHSKRVHNQKDIEILIYLKT